LNNGTGTLVSDASPNSLDGTLYNATWMISTSCFGTFISGCTDVNACNYNPAATINDSSCYFVLIQINQNVIDLDVSVNSGISPFTYLWNTGETIMIITPQQNGVYWVVVTDVNGCLSDTSYFNVNNIPTSINEENSEKEPLKIVDVLGKETTLKKNTILFYIYKNGKVEKLIITK